MAIDPVAAWIRWGLYPAMQLIRGNKVMHNVKQLQQSACLSRKELSDLQREKLRRLLEHCAQAVPAYENVLDVVQIQRDPWASLRSLPVLSKAMFRERAEQFLVRDVIKEQLIPNRTGGSTGEPVRFYLDRKTVEFYEAARWRGLSWWGIQPWSRSIMVWGSPIELERTANIRYVWQERWLKNRLIIPAYRLQRDQVATYAALIDRYRPDYLYGYGGALAVLAELFEKEGVRLRHRPKVVVYTAEGMTEEERERAERRFNAPTAGEYGARDGGIIAFECRHGSMHLAVENVFLETVDPRTGQPAEEGSILVTDLNNFVQPRLRYALGDWGRLAADDFTCPCGMQLPVLGRLEGREDAMFVATDGSLVHGHIAAHVARETPGVKQIQVIQRSRQRVTVRLVLDEETARDTIRATVVAKLQEWLGPVQVDVELVPKIEPSASGKYRYAIREFALN